MPCFLAAAKIKLLQVVVFLFIVVSEGVEGRGGSRGQMAKKIGKYHLGPMIGEGAYGQCDVIKYNNFIYYISMAFVERRLEGVALIDNFPLRFSLRWPSLLFPWRSLSLLLFH